jgi:hypothetical protein
MDVLGLKLLSEHFHWFLMIGLYTPLLILQAFCIYHAYRNNVEQRWYWFIIFFPGVGCALYLYHALYSRNNLQKLTESVKDVVNTNYRIEKLEKAVQFSDSTTNKINLADGYVAYGRYEEAIALYESCLIGYMADDPIIRMKILRAFYCNKNFDRAVTMGELLDNDKEFKNAEERIDYAWSLYRLGRTGPARFVFNDMNRSYTNYKHRVEYCRFLLELGEPLEAGELLKDLVQELDHMKGPERRLYRNVIREIRELESVHLRQK